MKCASFIILVSFLLSSCVRRVPPTTSVPLATPSSPKFLPDRFEVEAWVNNPTPAQGSRLTVSGSLLKNGVRLGGMMMEATWPDKAQERGVPNCYVQVIYGSGVCTLEVNHFPRGIFVPITVTFAYGGHIYIGHTGFTPQ